MSFYAKIYLLLLLDMVNFINQSNRSGIRIDRPIDQRITNFTRRTNSITRFLGRDEAMKKMTRKFRGEGRLRV